MTYNQISSLVAINDVDETKVNALVKSMLKDGWKGCPLLVYGEELITGSHRFAALKKIDDMVNMGEIDIDEATVLSEEVAENVTEIVDKNIAKFGEEHGWIRDIDLQDIGWMLKDSWVEEYKDEMIEW